MKNMNDTDTPSTGIKEFSSHEEAVAEARHLTQQMDYKAALEKAIKLNQIKED